MFLQLKPSTLSTIPTTWSSQNGIINTNPAARGFDLLADTRSTVTGAAAAAAVATPQGEQTPLSHVTQQVIPVAYGNVKPYSTPWMQTQTWPSAAAEPPSATPVGPSVRYPDNVNVLMWHPMAVQSHVEPYANSATGPRPNTGMINSTSPPVPAAANTYYKPPTPFWFGGGNSEYGYQNVAPGFDLRYAFPATALTFHGRTARLVNPMYRPQISEQHRAVTCTLHNADLWKIFNRHTTEMVITKAGR